MKKILIWTFLYIFSCNFAFSETIFYEDFTFHGKMITDVYVNKVDRSQQIQMVFPSYLENDIPFILNGHAKYTEIDKKPYVMLNFDQLSTNLEKSIPVEIEVTAINGKKISNTALAKEHGYIKSFKRVNGYSKDVLMFPINRYKLNPTNGKPTKNTFIMLLEPVYLALSGALFLISPVTALFCPDEISPDIKKGSMLEFNFLQELTKKDLDKLLESQKL